MTGTTRKNELFATAMSKLMKNKLGVSIDLLDEILKADPEDRLAWLARGSVYLKMGKTENAIGDFSNAIELSPNHPKAYHLSHCLLSQQKKVSRSDPIGSIFHHRVQCNQDLSHACRQCQFRWFAGID